MGTITSAGAEHLARLSTRVGGAPLETTVVADKHHARDWRMRRLLALADATALGGAVLLAGVLSSKLTFTGDAPWLLMLLPAWLALCWLYRLYDRDVRKVSHTTVDDLPALFHATLVATVGLWLASRALPVGDFDFSDVALIGGALLALEHVLRAAVRATAARRWPAERVLFVGGGEAVEALAARMVQHPHMGLEPVASLRRRTDDGPLSSTLPTVGTLGDVDLDAIVSALHVERVVVADSLHDQRLLRLLHQCQRLGVKLDLIPASFGVLGSAVEVDDIGGLMVLAVNPPVLSRTDRAAKRTLDVLGSTALLLLALPILVSIAVAVRVTSPGPVFFRQERVGRGGRRFKLLKFRSMCADAEEQRADLLVLSKDPDWLHLDDDPRVTTVGRVLRNTSLDELPQLWNVLKGDMSLVGPRPLIVEEDSNVDGFARGRLDLTPGITGIWQVLGRTTIPFEEMVKLDYLYVTNWSLWADLRLMLRTLPAVLLQRGAN